MAKKTTSANQKRHYLHYKTHRVWAINRKKKLERHLKKYPNDAQAKKALNDSMVYRRKRPNKRTWSHSLKTFAEALRKAGLPGNIAIKDVHKAHF